MTTKNTSNTRNNGNGKLNNTKGEVHMQKNLSTTEFMAKMLDAMTAQNAMLVELARRIDTLERGKAAPAPKKPAETKVQTPKASKPATKEVPAPARTSTRTTRSAKKPAAEPTDAAKKLGLKVVKKFDTQMYLRVPRGDGNVEVAHINLKTKRGNCVATIHAKAEKSDMGLIREFILAYADKLTYTDKLAKAGITNATTLAKASNKALAEAFGC